MDQKRYADIIIPGALANSYTYLIGDLDTSKLSIGSRVIVPFGRSRHLIGVVEKVHSEKPEYSVVKKILGVPEYVPSISSLQLEFWKWISKYYLCTTGEVMDAALPSGLKLQSVTSNTNETHEIRYKPKVKPFIRLTVEYSEMRASALLDQYAKAPARYRLLSYFLESTSFGDKSIDQSVAKSELLKGAAASEVTLGAMIKQNVFEVENREVERLNTGAAGKLDPLSLSSEQQTALGSVRSQFEEKDTVLLHGVTSSGKTELYIHLIKEQIDKGKQVLYLLPEIALTSQIINRLRTYFGEEIGVYHSRFSDNERVEVWRRIMSGYKGSHYRIILGVRSSLFLPFDNLGLVIVDEEHDASYKQKDPAPRYNARDSSIVLAKMHGAKVLLGSATPSVESVYNTKRGKYGMVELSTRYGNVKLPEIEIADTKEAYRRKIMISHFTPQLISATEEALKRGEQVVFFRNRRGYAPILMCKECGWTPVCKDCSVNMTYHKGINRLKCHYCGTSTSLPNKCENCSSNDIIMKGFGTEKIEDEISMLFPEARVHRMDLDTTRKKGSIDKIISRLEDGKIDILVGTQMISKGLDFENLTLVGVLNVDNMLHFPDFRAGERCFQMIVQVSGRAGRREKTGRVVIDTFDPGNSVIRLAINHNFEDMYNSQLVDRKEFGYPPYTRLIKIHIRHKERNHLTNAANYLANSLRENIAAEVLGPEYPVISRIQAHYFMTILIKIDRDGGETRRVKNVIQRAIEYTYKKYGKGLLRIYADVDPV